jgi:hypothetical protein
VLVYATTGWRLRASARQVLAKEKLLRGALRSVSRGMDDSFSCLYQLALAYFRGQVNAAGQRSATGAAYFVT